MGVVLAAVGLAALKVVQTKNIQIVVKEKEQKKNNGKNFFSK